MTSQEEAKKPLIHRHSRRISRKLYTIFLWAKNQGNSTQTQIKAVRRARKAFLSHGRFMARFVYRTRAKPVIGRNAKQLTAAQFDKIVRMKTYLQYFRTILADSSRSDLEFVCFHAVTLREASEEYWRTAMGLKRRIDMLGANFHYNIINGALQVYGGDPAIKGWLGVAGISEHCEYCLAKIIGRTYDKGQFLPRLPAHHRCTCTWRLVKKGGS